MLIIYGVPLSQPTRAVIWACLLKKLPFKLELIIPGNKKENGSRNPEYLKKNPAGTIPAIDDDGFILWESNAILTYLAQKHGWTDLYPSDLKQRSLVDQYLHWHHRNARESTFRGWIQKIRKDIKFPPGHVEQGIAIVVNALRLMDQFWLQSHKFVAGDTLSLADIACYTEFGQLNAKFGNLLDFSPYPKVQQWMTQMESVPFFTEANAANAFVGDMNNGVTPEIDEKANKEGWETIMQAVQKPSVPKWEVVGGADKGGIIVRSGQDLTSSQMSERLSISAIVEELALAGERLNYRLISGNGPVEGWVSTKLKEKMLLKLMTPDL